MSTRLGCFLVLLAVGCTRPSPNPSVPEKDQPRAAVAPPSPTVTPSPTDANGFARQFLGSVHDGTATAAQLTPEFKKVIAEPVFEADRAGGYSDAAADSWLKHYQGRLPDPAVTAFGGDAAARLYFATVPGEKPRHVALRLAKADDGWRVDWFLPAEVEPAAVPPTGDAAAFAAVAFLDALVGKQPAMAAALMTPAAKARLAPAFGSPPKPYSVGGLEAKLTAYRGNVSGFRVTKAEAGGVGGELVGGGAAKPFALKLVPGGRPFDWLVDDVKID